MKKNHDWLELIELISQIRSTKTLDGFFHLFFTIEERETLVSRFLIIKALLDGKLTQREIAKQYGVSISQITRGSNALKIIDDNLRKTLKK
jgi:TrpR family transcriptional regulator, trp operon repressor